ncbi:MAG: histidine kinase [Spirochaetales bacterium]|nr:histidine kinase [Spirochaetales bacterium]
MNRTAGKNRAVSIRLSLFIYGFLPMFICTLLFSIILLAMTTRLLKQREEYNLISTTRVLSNLLDSELRKIKRVSLNLAYSNTLREGVKDYIAVRESVHSSQELYYGARRIQGILDEMAGPLKQIPQVNIILPDYEMICFGQYNLSQKLPDHLQPRLRHLLLENKTSWWSPPERDFLSEQLVGMDSSIHYISRYQILFDEFRQPLAYIEVKQQTDTLFNQLKVLKGDVQVFNNQNLQLYPRTLPQGSSYSVISSEINPYSIVYRKNSLTGEKEVLCLGLSTEASWRIIKIVSESRYLSPVYRLQITLIPLVLLIALLGYLISHRLSRGISSSLSNLNRKLNQLQWRSEAVSAALPDETGIRELNDLELSFAEMNRKMDEKLDLFVAEKTLELNARMLALQSQMDPHFLFNMLSIIDVMADEGKDSEIQDVIRHLSSLLRYTSSLREPTVPLSMELKMARHYMKCISFRFGDTVRFIDEVPDELMDLKIPKYSVIPLLENAVKYGMSEGKTCYVQLAAGKQDRKWTVTVRDNGPGFSEEKLNRLKMKIHEGIHNPQMQLNNQINGMGLFNICARYSLLYGRDFLFKADNRQEGGAAITLGGIENE